MNYWLLTTEFPPYFGGGISTYCTELLSALCSLGVKPTVFVADHSLTTKKAVTEGEYRVVRFHPGHWVGDFLQGRASLAFAFKEVVLDALTTFQRPDVIEAQDYCGLTYFLSMEKLCGDPLLQSIPIAVTMHTPEYCLRQVNASVKFTFPEFWNDEMERFSLRAADMVWAPSHNVISMLDPNALSVRPDVIRNPYTMPAVYEGPAEGLLYFGRVQRLKGIEPLLAAYSRLVRKGLREPLDIIGGDASYEVRGVTMMDHLKKAHRELIEQGMIRFAGLMDRDAALDRVKKARVAVIPSLYENFSYAALEAMSFGRVVVTSRQCGHSEIMRSGHDGLLFDHNVAGDLEAKLEAALGLSEEERSLMGANARATVASACAPKSVVREKIAAVERYWANPVGPSNSREFPFLRLARVSPMTTHSMASTSEVEDKGLLSIVIPYFNLEAYLGDAIESALAVDYANTETIVVNSSSTKPESIAEFYRMKKLYQSHPKTIRFVHIADKGLADTRNRGAMIAKGEFVTFLDSDDMVQPNYYSKAIDILNRFDNVGFVGCWVKYFEASEGNWVTWNAEPPYLLFHNTLNSASAVYRRDAFLRCGGNDTDMFVGMEDYEMLVRLVACGYGGVAIPRFLFDYRVRADSMMRQLAPRSNIFNYQQIAEKNPEIFAEHAISLCGLLNANGPGYRHDNPLVSAGY